MKICFGNKSEFISIWEAIDSTNTYFDFITVNGGEGATKAAPLEYSDHVGMPMQDALSFVHDCLNGFDLKKEIKIICSVKIILGFDIIKSPSKGEDLCNFDFGMILALGLFRL